MKIKVDQDCKKSQAIESPSIACEEMCLSDADVRDAQL